MNPKNFADLRNILAELITDEQSIRRIVDDAGLDRRNIDFRSNVKNIWHSVLTEAENLHRVEALLDVVADEYGANQKFQAAGKAYRESINKTAGIPVGLHTAGNRQQRPVNPWHQRLSALFLGLLLIGFVGGGWYWGIFGPRANDGSIATATPTLPAALARTTVVATLVPTDAPTLPLTSSLVTAIATNLALTDIATVAATPTITDVASSGTVQRTAVFTATATFTPTQTPQPTVTATSTAMPAYPCEAEIVSPRGVVPVSINFRELPGKGDRGKSNYQPGDKIIIKQPGESGKWYLIAELSGLERGWAPAEYFTDCSKRSE